MKTGVVTTGVVTTSFPRHEGDFAGCFVEDAVRALADAGETVEVVAAGEPAAQGSVGLGAATDVRPDLGPRIRIVRVRPSIGSTDTEGGALGPALFFGAGAPEALEAGGLAAWVQAASFWAGLCDEIRKRAGGWRRIVAHWLVPSALAARAVAAHLPLTAHAHSGDVALLERIPGGAALGGWLGQQITELVFASTDLRDRFARLTGRVTGRVAAVRGQGEGRPDGFVWPCVTPVPLVHPIILLSVGRLVPIKGFDVLLRAVAQAAAERRAPAAALWSVVILGDGPERSRLESIARRLNLALCLPGWVSRSEVATWMRTANLYVQPSRRLANGRTEGLPTATLEAIAAGLPILASRTGGLGEISGPGIDLVDPDNVWKLAKKLSDFTDQQPIGPGRGV